MEPLAGVAPARFSYKEDPQAAAKRQKKWWAATVLPRVLRFKRPLHHSLMLAAHRKWISGLLEFWITGKRHRPMFLPFINPIIHHSINPVGCGRNPECCPRRSWLMRPA